MASKKKYIITSITLGVIAAVSAGLIGLTNLITRCPIDKNEKEATTNSIREVFVTDTISKDSISYEDVVLNSEYTYVKNAYLVKVKDNNVQLGYAFKTSGYNSYGKVTLIVGFAELDHSFLGTATVENEQTYASKLENEYIDPLNKGSKNIDEVDCGATFGAKLVRKMINEASQASEELWK